MPRTSQPLVTALTCAALTCAAACGLFPDLGPLASSGSDAAAQGDSATSDSALADAADGAVASGFCATSTHAFCADFDTGALLDGWNGAKVDAPAGALTLATDLSVSPSRSLLATMARRATSDPYADASLEKTFTGWRHVIIEFDFSPKAPSWQPGDVNSGLFALTFASSTTDVGVALSMGEGYTTLGTPGPSLNDNPIPTGGWLHAHVDVDPAGSLTADFGPLHFTTTFAALTPGQSPTMTLDVGVLGYNQPAPDYDVHYDNVTVDFP